MAASLYRWNVYPEIPLEITEKLSAYPRIQRKLLYNRGISTPVEAGIYLRQQGSLYDPFFLNDMDRAIRTILAAVQSGKSIAVYGDYDVDGVTATCILVQVLQKFSANVRGYIPNRFEEGYGVNSDALQSLHDEKVQLIITVDCGIRSAREVEFARELGMEMIICDHHEPSNELPEAAAVICPKKAADQYPDKNLAGVGLAYKITEALLHVNPIEGISADDWIDLTAIGTVADMVPLTNENRSLVKSGIEKLQRSTKPAIQALAEVSGVRLSAIKASTIGFAFGPRLNAAGRLETAKLSLDLLMSDNLDDALSFARSLDEQNKLRQELTKKTQESVIRVMDSDAIPKLIAASDPDFNMGVVGLAASRLTEKYYRPAIVGACGEEFTRASCRSIPEFHITNALDQCADLLERHGGHAMAAGFTVKNENWPVLIQRLLEIARQQLSGKELYPSKIADMEIPLEYFQGYVLDQIAEMEPFGFSNPEAIFVIRNLQIKSARPVGVDQSHLRLSLISENNIGIDGIAFRQAFWAGELPGRIDVLCSFEKNTWRDKESLQLNIIDIRPSNGLK
jgi:single-stranded-DNA-specific exonuclease